MLKVKDLSKELSFKLGDPVQDGSSDGAVFTSDKRLGYVNRAYGKLMRNLKALMRDEAPEFTQVVTFNAKYGSGSGSSKNTYPLDPYIKIIDIYAFVKKGTQLGGGTGLPDSVTINTDGKTSISASVIRAKHINPSEFLTVLQQANDLRTPSFEKGEIYFTELNKEIVFLPESNKDYSYQGYYYTIIGNTDEFGLENEIYITNNYKDLLVLFAAYEGMQDMARADKVQLYGNEINNQLQILSQYAQLEKREEGISEQISK